MARSQGTITLDTGQIDWIVGTTEIQFDFGFGIGIVTVVAASSGGSPPSNGFYDVPSLITAIINTAPSVTTYYNLTNSGSGVLTIEAKADGPEYNFTASSDAILSIQISITQFSPEACALSSVSISKIDEQTYQGNDGQVTASATGGTYSVEYSIDSTNGTDGTWQSSGVFSNLPPGAYTVWARDQYHALRACANESASVTVVAAQQPTYEVPSFGIELVKYPPIAPLRIVMFEEIGSDAVLENKPYQFTYRYVYKDRMKSVWGPRSTVATPSNDTQNTYNAINIFSRGFIFGLTDTEETSNDGVNGIAHTEERAKEFIDYIEVAVRETSAESWKLIGTVNLDDILSNNLLLTYRNNGRYAVVSDSDINQAFDTVPILSEAGAVIDNQIMLGNNTEEFPDVDNFKIINPAIYNSSWIRTTTSSSDATPSTHPSYRTQYPAGDEYTRLFDANAGNTLSFKDGGIYQLGVIFGDRADRRSLVYTSDELNFSIPWNRNGGLTTDLYSVGFQFDPTFTPPEWATHYQIVRSNALNIAMFIRAKSNGIKFLQEDLENEFEYKDAADAASASYLQIDIRNWIFSSIKTGDRSSTITPSTDNPPNNIFYNFQEGDRVRFGGNISGWNEYDLEIKEFKNNTLIVPKPEDFGNPIVGPAGSVIEVYRPQDVSQQDSIVYYECGEWYPILNPHKVNRAWSKSDWTFTNIAGVSHNQYGEYDVYNNYPVRNGDVHLIYKETYFDLNPDTTFDADAPFLIVSSMNPDPERIWDRWEHAEGRPNVAYTTKSEEIKKETQIRFGGLYVQESLLNSLNNFQDPNQKVYPAEYGPIRKLIQAANNVVESVGNILLSIHENEAVSIYISKATIQDLAGSSQVALADRVLGSFNTLLGSHGTKNPESVWAERNMVYWWDSNNGEMIRYSRDGLTEISGSKMINFFKDMNDLLLSHYNASEKPVVIGGFDRFNNEFLCNFKHSTLPATFKDLDTYKTLSFSEDDKRWKSFWSFEPDMFASINTMFMAFKDGKLYIHEEGGDNSFNNFYGTKYDSKIQVAFNVGSSFNKIWKSMAVEAIDKWEVIKAIGDKVRPSQTQQVTQMLLAMFDEKESTFYSEFARDENTPNMASTEVARLNGDEMRSKALLTTLRLDPDVDYLSILYYLHVGYRLSNKNPGQ